MQQIHAQTPSSAANDSLPRTDNRAQGWVDVVSKEPTSSDQNSPAKEVNRSEIKTQQAQDIPSPKNQAAAECLLKNIADADSDTAALLVMMSCNRLYSR
jgi:hypothetical protein